MMIMIEIFCGLITLVGSESQMLDLRCLEC
jgi:hypothetical protein